MTHSRKVRAGRPVNLRTVDVMCAGMPTEAAHEFSGMYTTVTDTSPLAARRKSLGASSS